MKGMNTKGETMQPLIFSSASPSSYPEEVWNKAFQELGQQIKHYFSRQEPHHRVLSYVPGMLSEVSRKKGGK
jgi:hypothetical protein